MKYRFLGKEISGIFTIPSGIITTEVKVIKKIANGIPEIGVITTKSIGLEKRQGNKEPVLAQYAPGCFINAFGLTNPGAEEFARQIRKIKIPKNKFILTSIFGKDKEEFVKVARILVSVSDGLELNLSCPHASGYGMAIGQNAKLVEKIIRAVKKEVGVPVIAKLSYISNFPEIVKAAIDGGADALCVINTVGPGYYSVDGYPVLSNEVGGMSGRGILPLGLKCVREILEKFRIPVIGCGGITSVVDVRAYRDAGVSIFGVGSALVGLSTEGIKQYFYQLNKDFKEGTNKAVSLLRTVDMNYKKYELIKNKKLTNDLSLLVFDKKFIIEPGQFVFAWIPEVGEKPFSVLDDEPLTLVVQKRGCFTEKIVNLRKGSKIYFRGPYGVQVRLNDDARVVLVGGGCGLAALYLIAKKHRNTEIFFGAKDKNHLFYLEEMKRFARIHITTEDGSEGYKGLITELLSKELKGIRKDKKLIFFNCGPEKMVDAVMPLELNFSRPELIYSSLDYITRCGVGLCGSCATKDGRRLCVDGPFLRNINGGNLSSDPS